MSSEIASLATLGIVVAAGCFARLNIGVLSFLLAFALGYFFCDLPVAEVAGGFPSQLFLRLTGITLLFSLATVNGALDQIAWRTIALVRADPRLVALLVFGLSALLASSGAGNFATTAMLSPVVMGIGGRLGVSSLLMSFMLVNGASSGAFSPIAPTGIVAAELMGRMGMGGSEWAVFLNSLAAHTLVALVGYFVLGGHKLRKATGLPSQAADAKVEPGSHFGRSRLFTIAVIAGVGVSAVGFQLDIGIAAFIGAALLILSGVASESSALKSMPWGVILMVCGVTTLVEVIQAGGGIALFARLLSGISDSTYLPGVIALVAGVLSVYASSIGVVMPALLPAVPTLIAYFGGGNPLMVAFSINVGAHLVDISPLSPLGAMCLAYAPPQENRQRLFRQLMTAGWLMAFAGSVLCQLLFGYR